MFANARSNNPPGDFKVVKLGNTPKYTPPPMGRYDHKGPQRESEENVQSALDAGDELGFKQRQRLLDDEAAADGSKRMVPEYFAHLSDPANPKNRRIHMSENSVGGIGREPSPNKKKDYFTDVCNQKTDPKYHKPVKMFKADKQIEKFGQVVRGEHHPTLYRPDQEGHDPVKLGSEDESPRRYGKAICKAKLDELIADESANRCAGLPSEKVSETDERVVYDTKGDPIKWDGMAVRPTLQRHRGYAQQTVQRTLALQEVGCVFPTSPTRHRCLEGTSGESEDREAFGFRHGGDFGAGLRDHRRDPQEEANRRSHFVIG